MKKTVAKIFGWNETIQEMYPTPMTPEEASAILTKEGYKVTPHGEEWSVVIGKDYEATVNREALIGLAKDLEKLNGSA